MRLGWYRLASPKLHWGFSCSHSQSLFFFFNLCVSATQLSGQKRVYLSRLVFPSTKLRMNESNPSVFDPQTQNVLLFSLWWWRRWKTSFFLFFSKAELWLKFFCVKSHHLVVDGRDKFHILIWISWDHLTLSHWSHSWCHPCIYFSVELVNRNFNNW